MGKNPAFQFYVKDWLTDEELRKATPSTRGIWIDILCYMWGAKERGKLQGSFDQIARMVAASNGDLSLFIKEAEELEFCDILVDGHDFVTIINRRMYREERRRNNWKKRKQKQRGKEGVTEKSRSHSPTPTPSPKKNYKKEAQIILSFLNEKMGKNYGDTSQIEARLKEGGTVDQCKKIIETKLVDPYFLETPKLMNPVTLFRKIHWDVYVNESPEDYKKKTDRSDIACKGCSRTTGVIHSSGYHEECEPESFRGGLGTSKGK